MASDSAEQSIGKRQNTSPNPWSGDLAITAVGAGLGAGLGLGMFISSVAYLFVSPSLWTAAGTVPPLIVGSAAYYAYTETHGPGQWYWIWEGDDDR